MTGKNTPGEQESRKKCTILNGDLEAQNESKVQNQGRFKWT
jgi:hypothetical protein